MSTTLDHLLTELDVWLNDTATEEICIHATGEAWIFAHGAFTRHAVSLDAEELEDIAIVAAAQRRQDITHRWPLLATDLGGRGRLQAILHPCVAEGRPCLVIRRGSEFWPTMSQLSAGGLFKRTKAKRTDPVNERLMELYRAERWEEFFSAAVGAGMTILGCGLTAAGKTTFMKACIREIPRTEERIITIEDTPELVGLDQFYPNSVQLFYDKDGAGVKATDLIEASLRMRPDRLLLQEVRDGEAAIAFTLALQTGFKGMTTIHAAHCEGAFDRLRFVIKQTPGGAAIGDADLMTQLHDLIDVVVHTSRSDGTFAIDQVWFAPAHRQAHEVPALSGESGAVAGNRAGSSPACPVPQP